MHVKGDRGTPKGNSFPDDFGLTACALCSTGAPLRQSHIIPEFVYDWLKRTAATGHIRSGHMVNRRVQDGPKPRLLCPACEGRLAGWEKAAAEQVFVPIAEAGRDRARYGPCFARFAVSVSWRILTCFSLVGTLAEWPERLRADAQAALHHWREFMFDRRENPGRFEQHALRFDLLASTTFRDVPANLNFYLARTVDRDVAHDGRSAFVYAKMGPLVLFGVIAQAENVWKGTRVGMRHGTVGGDVVMPLQLFRHMLDRARRLPELAGGLSERQRAKVNAAFRADLDRARGSGTMRAVSQDVEMFGTAAFADRSPRAPAGTRGTPGPVPVGGAAAPESLSPLKCRRLAVRGVMPAREAAGRARSAPVPRQLPLGLGRR
jgi:hypothetical protein